MTVYRCVRFLLGFVAAGLPAFAAFGQSAVPTQGSTATSEVNAGVLHEVVVTAERRRQNLQNVSISATVLSASDLQKKGVTDVFDLTQAVPSVSVSNEGRSTLVNIRGVGLAQVTPTSSPGVAFYVDGILIPHEEFIALAFYDIGSIEVLRGPQGTLTGQTSVGGAIYLRTPDPKFNAYSGYADLTGGNYSTYRSVGAVNLGFNDHVALRIAAVHDEHGSFVRNIGPSASDPGDGKLDSVRADLAIRGLDDRLKVNVRGVYYDYTSSNIPIKNRDDLVTPTPFIIEQDARSYLDRRGYRLSAELHYDLTDNMQLRAITGWQDGVEADQTDRDLSATALPGPGGGGVTHSRLEDRTWTNEINLLSTGHGPVQWVVGAYSMNDDVPLYFAVDQAHTTDYFSPTTTYVVSTTYNRSRSVFGQATWTATSAIDLIAGARYNWDTGIFSRSTLFSAALSPPYVGTPEKSTKTTGKVGVNYHLSKDVMMYATASKGYKAGGQNLVPGSPNFVPETNLVYELGVKSELLDHHLRADADVFRSDYKNIQFETQLNGLPVVENVLQAISWGGEFELTGRFGGLGFSAGVGYLHGKYAQNGCISNADLPGTSPGCPTGSRAVPEGTPLAYAPEWTINAGVQYAIALGGERSITPRLQWSHLSRQYATPFPSPVSLINSRSLLDARLTYAINDRYTVEGFVNNLTNEVYVAQQFQNTLNGLPGAVYGAPREYGVQLHVSFGE